MANPRVFVSSTYYDLKHIRSSLDIFIESLGYESVLSEKGDISYSPDMPLDESCYREVSSADIFVLIVGGRYGSEASNDQKKKSKEFYERYESVTKKEFEEANKRDIPTYVLVENSVYSEYQTYLRNKNNSDISYAHVDSVNIFKFIEQILTLPRNNPTKTFEKFSDIEFWLKEQWAGLFRELLKRMSEQKKFTELSHQVDGLKEVNTTLKTYLETLMKGVSPDESNKIIKSESERLEYLKVIELINKTEIGEHLIEKHNLDYDTIISKTIAAKSALEFAKLIDEATEESASNEDTLVNIINDHPLVIDDINELKDIVGAPLLKVPAKKSSNKPLKRD